jgi:hypothetical protein
VASPLVRPLPFKGMLVLACLVLLAGSSASAQDKMNGLPPFGAFEFDKFDTVNLQNLNAVFSIPIASIPGRGLSTNVNLTYNTSSRMIH